MTQAAQLLGHGHGKQTAAVVESVVADGAQALGQAQRAQARTAVEGVGTDGAHALGNLHGVQYRAVTEHVVRNGLQRCGQRGGGQLRAAGECVAADGAHRRGDHNPRKLGAGGEGFHTDLLQALGKRDAGQIGIVVEGVHVHVQRTGLDHHGSDLGAVAVPGSAAGPGHGARGSAVAGIDIQHAGAVVQGVVQVAAAAARGEHLGRIPAEGGIPAPAGTEAGGVIDDHAGFIIDEAVADVE